ncbi:uncharacterized protein LOC144288366 [Canis aureus]
MKSWTLNQLIQPAFFSSTSALPNLLRMLLPCILFSLTLVRTANILFHYLSTYVTFDKNSHLRFSPRFYNYFLLQNQLMKNVHPIGDTSLGKEITEGREMTYLKYCFKT